MSENPVASPMPRPSDGIREDRAAGRAGFWRCMLFILVAKALLEAFFFVGVVRQYGEEDLFVSLAMPSREPGGTYWDNISRFKNVHDWGKWTGDPSDMYAFRIAALYPNRMFTAVFGSSETSVMLWSAITGIGSVLLVGLIGRALAGDVIEVATTALLDEIVDFFPGQKRRLLAAGRRRGAADARGGRGAGRWRGGARAGRHRQCLAIIRYATC